MEIKELKKLVKFAKENGLKSLKIGGIEFIFDENVKPLSANKKTKMSRSDRDKLQKMREQVKIDEMMLMDPEQYEDNLAVDLLKDEVETDGDY